MSMRDQKCERCGQKTWATIMSMFNTQTICMECKQAEKKDPRYKAAAKAELQAVRRGNLNFPGIGRR